MTPQELLQLEDEAIQHYVKKHNEYIAKINEVDLDGSPPFLLAKVEYWYSWARNYAFQIASYYRKQQRRYEAKAKQDRANCYEETRKGNNGDFKSAQDAYNLAKKVEGDAEEVAGHYESQHDRWKGIAESYQDAANAIKDMVKSANRMGE